MSFALIAFGVGFVTGLRTLTAFTIASWAARLGRLSLQGSWLAFLGYAATPWIMSLAALGELVNDKLPKLLVARRRHSSRHVFCSAPPLARQSGLQTE